MVDMMPRNVKDLCPLMNSGMLMCNSNEDLSSGSDHIIEFYESNASTDMVVLETLDMPDDSSGNKSSIHREEMVPLQQRTRVKRSTASCLICDQEIMRL